MLIDTETPSFNGRDSTLVFIMNYDVVYVLKADSPPDVMGRGSSWHVYLHCNSIISLKFVNKINWWIIYICKPYLQVMSLSPGEIIRTSYEMPFLSLLYPLGNTTAVERNCSFLQCRVHHLKYFCHLTFLIVSSESITEK